MSDFVFREPFIEEALYARVLGQEVLKWAKDYDPRLLKQQVETEAVLLLEEIQKILDDDTLDDADCFRRIDSIVTTFHRAGIPTNRHWELD
jgi:hypothetical protein